jgi:hypothetical protein
MLGSRATLPRTVTTARYRHTRAMVPSQRSRVDWGGVSRRHLNPWVSARAEVVLHAAGRPVDVPLDTAKSDA